MTGHRTSVGALSITPRFELVAYDVRIAGAPPFESQNLARADRVVVKLRGPGGFFSPSEILIEGLDIEYLGTTDGDNLRGLAGQHKRPVAPTSKASPSRSPWLRVRDARLRGSVALPHGQHLAFRVPQLDMVRTPEATLQATLHRAVLDVEGVASLHALALTVDHTRDHLLLSSSSNLTVDLAGGGPLLDGLVLEASFRGREGSFELQGGASARQKVLVTGQWTSHSIELAANAQSIPLRSLGRLTARRALGLDNATVSFHASIAVDRPSLRAKFALDGGIRGLDLLHPSIDTMPWRNQDGYRHPGRKPSTAHGQSLAWRLAGTLGHATR
jgi:hypothetical protein